jgi:energy-coupling factor transporter transmembrane protein EcfT
LPSLPGTNGNRLHTQPVSCLIVMALFINFVAFTTKSITIFHAFPVQKSPQKELEVMRYPG